MKLKTLIILPLILSVPSITNAQALDSEKQQLSYIFGMQVGQSLKAENIEIDMAAFSTGFKDMTDGEKPRIEQEAAQKIVGDFYQKRQKELDKIAEKKQKQSEAFLTTNAKEKGVIVTKSGLQYKILKAGQGPSPTSESDVVAHYTGKLIDGTVFDSSTERGEPATLSLSNVIPGWQEGLALMNEGAKWQLVIPPKLAYGSTGIGSIGPNEALIFDIELVSIKTPDTKKKLVN